VDGLWATNSEGVGLIVRAISFQLIHQRHKRTDGQTDGRTTYNLNTALCTSASRGKIHNACSVLWHKCLMLTVYPPERRSEE